MAKHSLTFSIPQPCSESWHKMSPTAQGRFCMNCQEQVIDFSSMSDAEIVKMMEGTRGSVCGRFRSAQLNRPMVLSYNVRRPSPLKAILAGIVLLTVLNTSSEASVYSSTPVAAQVLSSIKKLPAQTVADTSLHIYKGRIISRTNGQPLRHSYVELVNSSITTHTDSTGRFELLVPDSLLNKQVVLYVHYIDMIEIHMNFKGVDFEKEQIIYVTPPEHKVMGKVMYVPEKHKKNKK